MTARLNGRSMAQMAAVIVSIVFLLVGILGFIPGITTNYDDLTFASNDSNAQLLGIFQVNVLHNIVHLLFGIVGLALARAHSTAVSFLIGGGIIYAVVWLYGLIIDRASSANFIALDSADNWLHLLLAVGMVALGVALGRDRGAFGTSRGRAAGV